MEKHRQTISGLLDVIEKYSYENPTLQSKLTSEMKLFRNAEGDLDENLQLMTVKLCFLVRRLF